MMPPPIAKIRTRTHSTFLPSVAATTSSSRTARISLPKGERATALRNHKVASSSTTASASRKYWRSEEHTSELQSQSNLVCRLLLEKKKHTTTLSSHRS